MHFFGSDFHLVVSGPSDSLRVLSASRYIGHAQGGKTCLHKHYRGGKALFCYVHHQSNGSAGGKTMENFSFRGEAMPPVPLLVRA